MPSNNIYIYIYILILYIIVIIIILITTDVKPIINFTDVAYYLQIITCR